MANLRGRCIYNKKINEGSTMQARALTHCLLLAGGSLVNKTGCGPRGARRSSLPGEGLTEPAQVMSLEPTTHGLKMGWHCKWIT